jgi:hypothetical protein
MNELKSRAESEKRKRRRGPICCFVYQVRSDLPTHQNSFQLMVVKKGGRVDRSHAHGPSPLLADVSHVDRRHPSCRRGAREEQKECVSSWYALHHPFFLSAARISDQSA